MKNIKKFCTAIMLISILATLIILSSCKTSPQQDLGDKTTPSGEIKSGEINSGNNGNVIETCTLDFILAYSQNKNPFISPYFDDDSKLNLSQKIDSVEELKTFCNDKQLGVFDNNSTAYNDLAGKKLREYDEEFFKQYSVVLVFRFNETQNNYIFDSLSVDNQTMTVNLISANGNTTANIKTKLYYFKIDKETAKTINTIDVNENLSELDKNTTIKIYEDYRLQSKELNYSTIINSAQDLSVFCNEDTSPYFKKNQLTIQDIIPDITEEQLKDEELINMFEEKYVNCNKRMIGILQKYDEEFFETKSLALIFRNRGNNRFFKIKDISIEDNSLNLLLTTPSLNGDYPVLESSVCVYILEYEKEKLNGINQINIKEIIQ